MASIIKFPAKQVKKMDNPMSELTKDVLKSMFVM